MTPWRWQTVATRKAIILHLQLKARMPKQLQGVYTPFPGHPAAPHHPIPLHSPSALLLQHLGTTCVSDALPNG